jgi:bacterioferritin (cytochrome b1)
MGFDLDRTEMADRKTEGKPAALTGHPDKSVFSRALSRNLVAEKFAIDAYRRIAEHSENYDKATLRLVKVALAVEEEQRRHGWLNAVAAGIHGINAKHGIGGF